MDSVKQEALDAVERHFAALQVGAHAVRGLTLDASQAAEYAKRHGLRFPGLHQDARGQLLVPPGMVFLRPAYTFGILEGPPMARLGIFTQTHRWYRRPIRVGEAVSLEGKVFDKYERRGYYYIAVRWSGSVRGEVVGGGEEWHTLGFVRDERGADLQARGERGPEPPPWTAVDNEGAGAVIEGEAVIARLPADARGVHDDTLARRAGLRGGFIVNEFHFAHLTEMLLAFFGDNWRLHGEIEVKYQAPLLDGQKLSPKARLVGRDGQGRQVLDVWCENEEGQCLAAGRARCLRDDRQ